MKNVDWKLGKALLGGGLVLLLSCERAPEWEEDDRDPRLSGGAQTVFTEGVGAFSSAFPTLSGRRLALHEIGDLHFESSFVAAPAPRLGGLGPVYNSNSCFNCHVNDGRGRPILGNEPLGSMLVRVSVPGTDAHGGPLGAPGFGGQLQDKAVFGQVAEAKVEVNWLETPFYFPDGQAALLRTPTWSFAQPYLPLPSGWLASIRVAPAVHGLGLLEGVAEADILLHADPDDRDGDGISGRANYVWDVTTQATRLGRFGWKAEAPSLLQQVAGAYNEDMGLTSYVFPQESSLGQSQYPGAGSVEVPDSVLEAVVFYVQTLAVPARRKVTDPLVRQGQVLFEEAGCARCHLPSMTTAVDVAFPERSKQRIAPYTDLLLHDMGSGLADYRPAYLAGGTEWRTPPLWGIGLQPLVNGHSYFLHDGRARNLMEAILWHGGEAERAAARVRRMPAAERTALEAFLRSL